MRCRVWHVEWSKALIEAGCASIVILPDADPPGEAHAEHVAGATQVEAPSHVSVKIARLPGLPRGADVFDWLEAGHTSDLLIEAHRAAEWVPWARERARQEHRRQANRVRQQRLRDRRRMANVRYAVNVQMVSEVA